MLSIGDWEHAVSGFGQVMAVYRPTTRQGRVMRPLIVTPHTQFSELHGTAAVAVADRILANKSFEGA